MKCWKVLYVLGNILNELCTELDFSSKHTLNYFKFYWNTISKYSGLKILVVWTLVVKNNSRCFNLFDIMSCYTFYAEDIPDSLL